MEGTEHHKRTWQNAHDGLNSQSVPLLEKLRVFRSPLHGYGLKATRDIAEGEIIAEVEGVLLHRNDIVDDTYCLWLDGEYFFDMVDQTRWVNHSCEPNSDIECDFDDHGGAWARIVALQPIKAGDEITYHYAFSQEVAERCNCGASSCEGWIVDPDEMPQLMERLAREEQQQPIRALEPVAQLTAIQGGGKRHEPETVGSVETPAPFAASARR